MERLTTVQKKIEGFLAEGGDMNSPAAAALGLELLKATDAVRVELGHDPLLIPIDNKSVK